MNRFKFRIWSTISGEFHYTDSQNIALRILHNSRSLDRIDYKRVGDFHGYRLVDIQLLEQMSIDAIYATDSRHDYLRAAIYATCGLTIVAIGYLALFNH